MHGSHAQQCRSPMSVGDSRQVSSFLDECDATLDFADLVGAMDAVTGDRPLSPRALHENGDDCVATASEPSFVVALFCDGFVCRHWTRKSGWVDGFAQSYDATSRYFLDCLEKERLPDGLLELIDPTTLSNELRAEIWDLRTHPTALCPLTAADLPHTAPMPTEICGVSVRQVVLKPRDQVVLTEMAKFAEHDFYPASEQFPQLSNADLEALTYDELASFALGPDVDLVQVDESLALLSVDEVDEPDGGNGLRTPMEVDVVGMDKNTLPFASGYGSPQIAVNDDDEHRDSDDNAFGLDELITPTRITISGGGLLSWEASSSMRASASPHAILSPNESKLLKPQAHRRGSGGRKGGLRPPTDEISFVSWPSEDALSSDDDWIVQDAVFRSIVATDADLAVVKTENPPSPHEQRRPTRQTKKKKSAKLQPRVDREGDDSLLEDTPPSTSSLHLSHPQNASNWIDDAVERQVKSTSKKATKKKKYRCLKPTIGGVTPLPATHLFLSRLKGKRPRNYTIDELDHGSPAWMMMKHMTLFYHSALAFERCHAHFLQVNVERIMTADSPEAEVTKVAAGSMDYLAMQLHGWTRPDEVIAASASDGEDPSIGVTPRRCSSPTAAETDWCCPPVFIKPKEDGDNVSSATLQTRPLDEDLFASGSRSPTSALAMIRITSPPLEDALSSLTTTSNGHSRPYLSSVQLPMTPLGGSPRTSSSLMDEFEGEVFEF